MARRNKDQKDRTSIIISAIFHVILIGAVAIWAWKTGKMEYLARKILQAVRSDDKKEKKEEVKQTEKRPPPPPKLPRINEGAAPPPSRGTRAPVAADAPAAAGETFFQDTRKQVSGAGAGAGGGGGASQVKVVVVAAAPPPPPRPVFASSTGPSTIKQLYAQRAKEAASTEAFGSEQIAKSGVSDAGAIIKNVSGAAVVDGKFAVIRGLSDRYVTTTFNGAEIPSADPYRRSASLDLFPAQIIDKVVVAKTFTPDQPGSYTGGGINIISKSFPEKGFASFSTGAAYNTQATGNKHFLTYSGGGHDWAGMDDGTRELPRQLASSTLNLPTPWPNSGSIANQAVYHQRIRDVETLSQATRLMGTTEFAAHGEAPPVNHNFSAAVGDTTHLLSKPFGVFVGVNYRHDYSFYENGINRRYGHGDTPGTFSITKNNDDARSSEVVNWAGVVNLAWQPLPDHEFSFNFLYNQNADNQARHQSGYSTNDPGVTYFQDRLQWTERNLNTYQLRGSHRFPEAGGAKLDWMGALAQTTQDEPDTRFFNYGQVGNGYETGRSGSPDPKNPTRYFRALDENNRNEKIDLTLPFRQWAEQEGEFKMGVFDSYSKRTFSDREIYYQGGAPFNGDPNTYLTDANLGFTATTNPPPSSLIRWTWLRYVQNRDSSYDAESTVRAAYAMLDVPLWTPARPLSFFGLPLVENVRLVGGARFETTDLSVDSVSYLAHSSTGLTTNQANIKQQDILPAVGLIIAMTTNMNLRLHYSQTVARPSFRELAAYRSYDPVLDEILEGEPRLQMSAIENYDLRWEWFVRPGELLSVSLFYKSLQNAIERRYVTIDQDIVSFDNRPKGIVYGVELEARKSLDFLDPNLRPFTLGGNVSLIQSDTDLSAEEYANKKQYVPNVRRSRALYDQSPFIINLDLSYDNSFSGTSASLLYNISGARITIAGITTKDVYEQPAPTLDFVLAQRITHHLTAKLTARNLLDPKIERSYGKNGKLLYSSYHRGLTFGASLTYDF